ncbi:MAG: tetratricopeptide repeat protein [Candidatus Cryptobacteroides sp.]|nr:tetratricopeptide repeat protein [Bacteroidales bacterium]MDY5743078.1 tetratricopeptide repeat protein [Candidatus Cryptobacteroides sp.]
MNRFPKHAFLVAVLLLCSFVHSRAQYDKDVFFWRGRQALADGKYAQSIENFNILAQLDTSDYQTYFFRGIAKYNLGDIRGAQRDFDNSVRLNPVFTSGYHYRAITESRFGRFEEALSDLQRAIDLRPGFTGLYYSRGVTYFLARQFENAVRDFDKYIRKEPKDPSAYLNRGACYLFLADTTKALSDYNKAIKLDRFDPEGYIRRGRLYSEKGDYEAAISDLDHAIELDSSNTLAYFNRALLLSEKKEYRRAMDDLNRVLKDEPGNALTLYNRGLINAQVGEYEAALSDMDRVLNINPENVLAYFNRASIFIEMERWEDALEDYDRAIELYPDFAKAYMNRSYVKSRLGLNQSSKEDYRTAQRKIQEYRARNVTDEGSFADTTRKYSSLIALDAEFARKDFNDEMLQHRDIDIRLRPMYRYVLAGEKVVDGEMLTRRYENPLLDRFAASSPADIEMANRESELSSAQLASLDAVIYAQQGGRASFLRSVSESYSKKYNMALSSLDAAIGQSDASTDAYDHLYKAFYLMNRSVLRAEMIDFIASMQSNVQVLTMDDSRNTRARVKEHVSTDYDYSEAIADAKAAIEILDNIPYLYFNLGNLHCLSSEHLASIENYTRAISLFPYMGDAYFNRGLVLIYLKDKEKGCIDLSRAGELGVAEAYAVIKKYCEEEIK